MIIPLVTTYKYGGFSHDNKELHKIGARDTEKSTATGTETVSNITTVATPLEISTALIVIIHETIFFDLSSLSLFQDCECLCGDVCTVHAAGSFILIYIGREVAFDSIFTVRSILD